MCGRYTSTATVEDLIRVFEVEDVRTQQLPLRYNVAPTQDVYAVANRSGDKGPRRALGAFRWGLIPSWSKDLTSGAKMINARAETIESKPAFRSAFERRRCIIPADAFYEWQRQPDKGRLPHAIQRRDGMPMAFGGIWEVWRPDPEADLVRTCSIVTTKANGLMAPLHDRMPLVLAHDDWATWLDRGSGIAAVRQLMVPAADDWFTAYAVSSLVNNVANEGPDLLLPLPPPPANSRP